MFVCVCMYVCMYIYIYIYISPKELDYGGQSIPVGGPPYQASAAIAHRAHVVFVHPCWKFLVSAHILRTCF